jgi:DNA-binding NtrC family response regulator
VVDDDVEVREMLVDYLKSTNHEVQAFASARDAFDVIFHGTSAFGLVQNIDLVVTDLHMPEMDGLELVERLKKVDADLPVILITAFGSIESAIEATKKGAFDYVTKPFKLGELAITIERALNFRKLKQENQLLRKEVTKTWGRGDIIGKSKAMMAVYDLIDRVSKATANVLIQGESGSGKEMVARAIHQQGPRREKPFVAINCTAIPDTLMESELFGYLKGAFTGAIANKRGLFEEAHGGTIFLDEIGDLDLALQAKLLRVIQEKRIKPVGDTKYRDVDVRIIAATHKDLRKAVKQGLFREDLFFRLAVIPVEIPPLRERRDDVPILAQYFLRKYAAANGSRVRGFSSEAMQRLMNAKWEGNVRELENIIERTVVLTNKEIIDPADIPMLEQEGGEQTVNALTADWPTLGELEKRYIQRVLEKTAGRKERASQILGINRRTLYRKEREYAGLPIDDDSEMDL